MAATGPGVAHRSTLAASLPLQGTERQGARRPDRSHGRGPARLGRRARKLAERVSDRAGAARHRRRVGLLGAGCGGGRERARALAPRQRRRRRRRARRARGLAALADPHTGSRAPRARARSRPLREHRRGHARRRGGAGSAGRSRAGASCPAASWRSPRVPRRSRPETWSSSTARGATDLASRRRGGRRGCATAAAASSSLSDGEQTTGDATRAVAAARARDVTIDAVPLADSELRDAALTRLDGARRRASGRHDLAARDGALDGELARRRCRSRATAARPRARSSGCSKGDNPFTLSYTAASAGWHSFRVRVRLPATAAQNDALSRERQRRRAAARDRGVDRRPTRRSRRS